jgi:hypothetical protein
MIFNIPDLLKRTLPFLALIISSMAFRQVIMMKLPTPILKSVCPPSRAGKIAN